MAKAIVQKRSYCNQAIFTMDGNMQKDLLSFVDGVIREYGRPQDNTYYLFASKLPFLIQKLFLIHLMPIEDYEYYLDRPAMLENVCKEYLDDMQSIIDERCDEVYKEDMEEMGYYLRHHANDNDIYYSKY